MMAVIPMLMTVEDLREVAFGHRHPRHGLKLLHWFSTVCVKFDEDGDMELQCDPDNGDYGFHHYGNFEYLLPPCNTYFEVGNLNTLTHVGAQDLPDNVREAYSSQRNCYERNKDRIIVSMDRASRLIGEVYITEHRLGLSDFNPEGTFLLSPDVIREAGNMQRIDFLTCAGFILIMSLGANLWEGSSSSDSSLDTDDTDDDWEDYGEWDGPEGNGSTGWEVPGGWESSLGEVCSGQPTDPNCMYPPDRLPIQNALSKDWSVATWEVQKQLCFQHSKADPKSQNLLASHCLALTQILGTKDTSKVLLLVLELPKV
ncbi:hypothetical protein SKAU_G00393040 [Synaphobranchus kaupii]|uniref:Uncharacterized protein n=1 Tax=Synaphobranchus kaupii TaxID=118154 RepID=A0A9Q1EC03_SYNKA|nr:hypothetical protein SKAU_G00393040 [Synaphobranchus kaupii]